jgi:hypothetical protein
VPIPLPEPIAPNHHDHRLLFHLPGRGFLRRTPCNVVTVDTLNHPRIKTFTTRSTSFAPTRLPGLLMAMERAWTPKVIPASPPTACHKAGTDCATSECPEACCHADGTAPIPRLLHAKLRRQPGGAGTNPPPPSAAGLWPAAITACPAAERMHSAPADVLHWLGRQRRAENSDCCEEDGVAICEAGTARPNRAPIHATTRRIVATPRV